MTDNTKLQQPSGTTVNSQIPKISLTYRGLLEIGRVLVRLLRFAYTSLLNLYLC